MQSHAASAASVWSNLNASADRSEVPPLTRYASIEVVKVTR